MTALSNDAQRPSWWNQDALRTRMLDALSLMLPSAEQFLLDTAAQWLRCDSVPASDKSRLDRQVRDFMADETAHQRAHRHYNARLAASGLPVAHWLGRCDHAVGSLADLTLAQRLALASAFEHLTAVFSKEIVRTSSPWLTAEVTMESRLWRWHCEEELAHSDVVFGLLPTVALSAGRRALTVLVAAAYLLSDLVGLTAAMCREDVRAGRSTSAGLALQACGFFFKTAPSLLRMGGGLVHVVWRAARTPAA